MAQHALREPDLTVRDILLSFTPAAKRTSEAKERLLAWRLPLILALQTALSWRLTNIASDDEALYIHSGHIIIANIFSGGAQYSDLVALYGTYFSGAPNIYPVLAAGLDSTGGLILVRFFSLSCIVTAAVCVYSMGRHLFNENVGLLSALVFALTGSVQFLGKLATFDAPCLLLVAIAATLAVTKNSIVTAPAIGGLLALASITKYAGLALVPFVLLMSFLATLRSGPSLWRRNFWHAFLRAALASLTFAGSLLIAYYVAGSAIAAGVQFTTTGRKALFPAPMSVLLASLGYDIGLAFALAVGGSLLMVRRRNWSTALIMVVMLGAGSVIQAASVSIHEFTSLDKQAAFSGLFCAVGAGVALEWALSKRGRVTVAALAVIWLLLIDGMWRSHVEYGWPNSIMHPISLVQKINVPGRYFSFDGDIASYYTQNNPQIAWYSSGESFSIFAQGVAKVVESEKSHMFTGFMFQTGNLSAQNVSELHVLERLLGSDPYYNETSVSRVSAYTKAVWQLWIHYPSGYHAPNLKNSSGGT